MIHDISPPVSSKTAVFPGDTPMSREVLLDMKKGDGLTLSTLHATVHLGAHADGPNHYGVDARPIDEQSLDFYIGPCQVIEARATPGERLRPEDLLELPRESRVLLKTGSWPDTTVFGNEFNGLTVELVDHLASAGVVTIGIDTPSVDLAASKDLEAHRAILKHDIAIIECLRLDGIEAGVYELIALPLKLVGFDASPVRAVLRTLG